MRKIEAEEARLFSERHAVRATCHVPPFQRYREQKLREGEREHQKRDAARAHAEKSDQSRAGARDRDAGEQPEPGVETELRPQHGDRIRAQAEKAGVTERHQSGEAKQEVEAHGEDCENEDLGNQRARVVGKRKRQREQNEQRDDRRGARAHRGRHAGRGHRRRNRDVGIFDAEQPLRPDQQHDQHREVNQKQRDALEIGFAERIGDPDQETADEGAAKAAHAADDDDNEGGDQDLGVHARVEAEHGACRDAAQCRQRYAESENAGKQGRDVGAKACRHGGVVNAGTDHGADAAALEHKP